MADRIMSADQPAHAESNQNTGLSGKYACGIDRRGKVARCSYLYLNDELEVGYEPDEALLDRKQAELTEICTRIAKAWETEEFPATPNPLCGWCDFIEICPQGQEYQKERDAVSGAQVDLPF